MREFKNNLVKPDPNLKPWVIWIWNLVINKEQLIEQFTALIANGFGGVAIRPGRDMYPMYLSEEFFELFETILKIAKRRNIRVRIADDFSLPWNGVFDTFLRKSKHLRAHYLVLDTIHTVDGPTTFSMDLENPEETIVVASQMGSENCKHLSIPAGKCQFLWKTPEGQWRLFVFRKEYIQDFTGGFVPNPFCAEVSQVYITNVMELLQKRFDKYIPDTFVGFINEMPGYRAFGNGIPWDDSVVPKFRQKYKKNILKLLPTIFSDGGELALSDRSQVISFLYKTMCNEFAYPMELWAKQNNISQWVLCPEKNIYHPTYASIDGLFPLAEGLEYVGIQNLNGTKENLALVRYLADTNVNEAKRKTVTVIGRNNSGDANTLQDLKEEVDLSLLSGTSEIIIDGFFLTADRRSYVKSPYNHAWYVPSREYMHSFCNYIARTRGLMAGLRYTKPVAVLAPSENIAAHYLTGREDVTQNAYNLWCATLEELMQCHLDFDIISSHFLESCTIQKDGGFGPDESIRNGGYKALIIPFASLITKKQLVFLEKLIKKHGRVIFMEDIPKGTFEGGSSAEIVSRIENIAGVHENVTRVTVLSKLKNSLKCIAPMVKIQSQGTNCKDVVCTHGIGDGYELYIFHNRSPHQDYHTIIELPHHNHFSYVDCIKGEIHEIPQIRNAITSKISACFSPKHTIIMLASTHEILPNDSNDQSHKYGTPFLESNRSYRVMLKGKWHFEIESLNALPLATWNVRIGLSRESGGFSHFYETTFEVKEEPHVCYLMIDGFRNVGMRVPIAQLPTVEININGMQLENEWQINDTGLHTFADEMNEILTEKVENSVKILRMLFGNQVRLYNIGALQQKGINRLAIRTQGSITDPHPILYPPVILGDFSVTKGSGGWAIDKINGMVGYESWTKYGYPYFTGIGTYRQTFETPNNYERLILKSPKVSEIIDIRLNGKPVTIRNWQPFEVDVTKYCEHRRNELTVRIANTVDNILRMNGRASGMANEMYLDVY